MPTPKPSKLRAKASSSNENKGVSTRNPSCEEPEASFSIRLAPVAIMSILHTVYGRDVWGVPAFAFGMDRSGA